MGDVVPFVRPSDKSSSKSKKQKPSVKHKGKTLCKSGFHKWIIEKDKTFDVKQGKLVTSYRCKRCSATKNEVR